MLVKVQELRCEGGTVYVDSAVDNLDTNHILYRLLFLHYS